MNIIIPAYISDDRVAELKKHAPGYEILRYHIHDDRSWLSIIGEKMSRRYLPYRWYSCFFLNNRGRTLRISINGKRVRGPVRETTILLAGWDLTADLFQKLFDNLPDLRWIHSSRTGVEWADLSVIRKRGILFTNARGIHSERIAEFVIACIAVSAKKLIVHERLRSLRRWREIASDDIRGSTVGIIGAGSIGSAIARSAKNLGMRVLGYDVIPVKNLDFDELYTQGSLERMLQLSDYVVICLPLTLKTKGLMGSAQLRSMKRTAYLINVGRADIIQEDALIDALRAKTIAGAVIDVYHSGMLSRQHPYYKLENVLLTHYSAHASKNADRELYELFLKNLSNFIANKKLLNYVNNNNEALK